MLRFLLRKLDAFSRPRPQSGSKAEKTGGSSNLTVLRFCKAGFLSVGSGLILPFKLIYSFIDFSVMLSPDLAILLESLIFLDIL